MDRSVSLAPPFRETLHQKLHSLSAELEDVRTSASHHEAQHSQAAGGVGLAEGEGQAVHVE